MEYNPNKPIKDFIERTIELAKEFEDHKYCITLQINLLLGTIILPKSYFYEKLENTKPLNKTEINGVEISYELDTIEIKNLLHCLRNGISHWTEQQNDNIKFEYENNEIYEVTIKGEGTIDKKKDSVCVIFNLKENGIINFMEEIYSRLEAL